MAHVIDDEVSWNEDVGRATCGAMLGLDAVEMRASKHDREDVELTRDSEAFRRRWAPLDWTQMLRDADC